MSNLEFITISSNPKLALQNAESRRLIRTKATKATRSRKAHEYSELHRVQSNATRETSQRGGMGRFRANSSAQTSLRRYSTTITDQVLPSKEKISVWNPLIEPLGGQAWTLLHYYRYSFRTHSWAIDAKKDWFAFVIEDQIATHATLSFVSLNRDLEQGSLVSITTLHHRNKALKLMRQRLMSTNVAPDDSLIGAVALLAIAEGLEGHALSAAAHAEALAKLVNVRGGVTKLQKNEALIKLVAWANLCHTSTFSDQPRSPDLFEMSDQEQDIVGFSSRDLELSSFHRHVKGTMNPEIYKLVKLLAILPRNPPNDRTLPSQHQEASQLIHRINQLLLSIHHNGLDLNSSPSGKLGKVLCYASHLYISTVLRQMPRRTQVVIERADRLYNTLEALNFDSEWDNAFKELYLLVTLWANTLHFCASVSPNCDETDTSGLMNTIISLQIKSIYELENWLGRITWINGYCANELKGLIQDCY